MLPLGFLLSLHIYLPLVIISSDCSREPGKPGFDHFKQCVAYCVKSLPLAIAVILQDGDEDEAKDNSRNLFMSAKGRLSTSLSQCICSVGLQYF